MAGLDIAIWTVLGTWALVIGTLVAMYWQSRQTQRLASANSILTLRERFDSPRMRQQRKELSTHLLNNEHEDITSVEVATFFELMGALTHHRVLEENLVWEAFGNWITNYYWALRHPIDLIGRVRQDLADPLVFHEFEWLQNRIVRLDERMLGPKHAATLKQEEGSRAILSREATLDTT